MLTRIMLFHKNLQIDFFSKFAQISNNVNKLGSGVFVETFDVSLFLTIFKYSGVVDFDII